MRGAQDWGPSWIIGIFGFFGIFVFFVFFGFFQGLRPREHADSKKPILNPDKLVGHDCAFVGPGGAPRPPYGEPSWSTSLSGFRIGFFESACSRGLKAWKKPKKPKKTKIPKKPKIPIIQEGPQS